VALTYREKRYIRGTMRACMKISCAFTCIVSKLNHVEMVRMFWNISHKRVTIPEHCLCKDRGYRRLH